MHCKNLFFLLLIFSINTFSYEEGFAKNKSMTLLIEIMVQKMQHQFF